MSKIQLYPSNVYTETYNDEIVDDMLVLYKAAVDNHKGSDVSCVNGWQSTKDLHTFAEFEKVVNFINFHANLILKEKKLIVDVEPVVDALWFNVNHKNGLNMTHIHAPAWYSGCLYLQVPDSPGGIVFTDPRPASEIDHYENMYFSRYNDRFIPHRGMLLMFPGWLPHYTEMNRDDVSRVVLCFNVVLKEKAGRIV